MNEGLRVKPRELVSRFPLCDAIRFLVILSLSLSDELLCEPFSY